VFIHGGFTGTDALNEFLAIDLELPDERQRRLKDEFAVKLDRDVKESAAKAAMDRREQQFLEKLNAARDRHARECEAAAMLVEDRRSSLPPLTIAPRPLCVASSAHTLWLQWPPVLFDALHRPLPHSSASREVTSRLIKDDPFRATEGPTRLPLYYLSMRGGFSNIQVGQRVTVAFIASKPKRRGKAAEIELEPEDQVIVASKDPERNDPTEGMPRFHGTCVKMHRDKDIGHFDVIYDDGAKE
jgi:hypothetical protein